MSAWFHEYGWLILSGLPLLAYEIVAIVTGKVPTITFDVRHLLQTFVGSLIIGLLLAALALHFLTRWPS